mmetsp:Transcript_118914/g.341637  ORF Transcript_118914/g.341637 Transcript_118914/m.341637 type:complete len:220 (-) Transcript_118914:302-961(-)
MPCAADDAEEQQRHLGQKRSHHQHPAGHSQRVLGPRGHGALEAVWQERPLHPDADPELRPRQRRVVIHDRDVPGADALQLRGDPGQATIDGVHVDHDQERPHDQHPALHGVREPDGLEASDDFAEDDERGEEYGALPAAHATLCERAQQTPEGLELCSEVDEARRQEHNDDDPVERIRALRRDAVPILDVGENRVVAALAGQPLESRRIRHVHRRQEGA